MSFFFKVSLFFSWSTQTRTWHGPRTNETQLTKGVCLSDAHTMTCSLSVFFIYTCLYPRYSSSNMEGTLTRQQKYERDRFSCSVAPQYWTWGNHMNGNLDTLLCREKREGSGVTTRGFSPWLKAGNYKADKTKPPKWGWICIPVRII